MTHPLKQLYTDPVIDESRLTQDLSSLRKDIPTLMSIHAAIKPALEKARSDKVVGSSLQSSVIISTSDPKTTAMLKKHAHELDSMFVVSSVEFNTTVPDSPPWSYVQDFEANGAAGTVTVLPPKQAKCSRCWRYLAPVEDALCGRCEDAVQVA